MAIRKYVVLVALGFFLYGCASDVTVRMRPQGYTAAPRSELLAEVRVRDLRDLEASISKREAAFGVPMGHVRFDPPEVQLVKDALEQELTMLLREKGSSSKKSFSCDLYEFCANTNTTPLYWDVIGRVRLVLKSAEKENELFGTHTVRTYVWPSESIIKQAMEESLKQVVAGLKAAV